MSGRQPPLVTVASLTKHFPLRRSIWSGLKGSSRRTIRAVDNVSLEIPVQSTFALVGESGCGKSTVARCLAAIETPSSGDIRLEGRNIARPENRRFMRGRLQMIFQDPQASLDPRWRVQDLISEPIRTSHPEMTRRERVARVDELLQLVGLQPSDSAKYPHQFSGGQRQRISIARALSSRPAFLICDEPTSALDVSVQAQILNLMKRLQRELGVAYLFISHNLAVVAHMADRVGVMYLGRIVEQGPARAVLNAPRHPYTRMLLDTVPSLTARGRGARRPLDGEVPSPIAPPPGCAFHPRCPFANDRCRRERPSDIALAPGHLVACHAVEERRLPQDLLEMSGGMA